MRAGAGRVFIAEDGDDEPYVWSGRFSAHWEPDDEGDPVWGPEGVTADEAIAWGRAQADRVLVLVGDAEEHYSAGVEPEPGLPRWPEGMKPRRRRWPGYEHLDFVADEPVDWEVRMSPPLPPRADGQELVELARVAVAQSGHACHVRIGAGDEDKLDVRFVVRACSHAEAKDIAHAIHGRLWSALPASIATGGGRIAVFDTGFDPDGGVRPLKAGHEDATLS